MRVLLTSCGLETEAIANALIHMLPEAPALTRALFIPTAACDPDAIDVLPKCLNDLVKIGVPRNNIIVHDLHDPIPGQLSERFDMVYLCGGSTRYLLRRINEGGFRGQLLDFIAEDGAVLGVSAGSVIFSSALPDNLGLLPCPLDVHCADETREHPGPLALRAGERIRLGNRQAICWADSGPVVME